MGKLRVGLGVLQARDAPADAVDVVGDEEERARRIEIQRNRPANASGHCKHIAGVKRGVGRRADGRPGVGTHALLIDDGFAAAGTWESRMRSAEDLIARAETDNRGVAVIPMSEPSRDISFQNPSMVARPAL